MPSHFPHDDRTPTCVIDDFIGSSQRRSDEARSSIRHTIGIKYGEDEMESFDCFYPDSFTPETEVVVFVHGGYWQEGDNSLHHFIAIQIVRSGKIAVFLDTQNAPKAGMTTIIEQCRKGFSKIISYFPNAKSMSISGHSSGAHKVFMTLAHDWTLGDDDVTAAWRYLKERLSDVILLCGVYELEHLVDSEVNQPLQMSREEARSNSPILLLPLFTENIKSWKNSRLILVHTEYDAITIKKWNENFIQEIKQYSVPNMKEVKIIGHDHFSMLSHAVHPDFTVTKLLLGADIRETDVLS